MESARPLIFGEALFDCFPDGREVLGGAPFNVAWNLQALGMKPMFISKVGNDSLGHLIEDKMTSWGMDTTFLQHDMNLPTGKVEITFSAGEPRFAILPDQAYDTISLPQLPHDDQPAFLYHGSLALRSENNRTTFRKIREQTSCPVFLDINLRKPWWNRDDIFTMIQNAAWLKLNDDECFALFPEQTDLQTCCAMLMDKFDLDYIFLTKGSKGATAFTSDRQACSVEPSGSTDVVDTVGAGDAFSSVLLLGLTKKWPMETILSRAQEFASAIVGQRGATLLDKQFYTDFATRWQ